MMLEEQALRHTISSQLHILEEIIGVRLSNIRTIQVQSEQTRNSPRGDLPINPPNQLGLLAHRPSERRVKPMKILILLVRLEVLCYFCIIVD
jgi:hypothetical protein